MHNLPSRARSLLVLAAAAMLSGCVERTIRITSEPPGALVFLNDVEIGRTPTQTSFLHYGTYSVRLVKEGYEPFIGPAEAKTPIYDMIGLDLVAELLPIRFESDVHWHFELDPVRTDIGSIVDRASQMRAQLELTAPPQ